ncbi:MAG: hypothetical protein WDW36_003543 [Sanguina aurantia]
MPASFRVPASLDDEQLSMPSPGTAASQRAGHDSLTVRLQRCMWKVQGPVDERAALVTTVVPIHAVLVLEVDAMPASFRVPASLDDEQLSMPSPAGGPRLADGAATAVHVEGSRTCGRACRSCDNGGSAVLVHAVLVLEVDAMPASFRVPASLDDEQLSMPSPAGGPRLADGAATAVHVEGSRTCGRASALVTTVVPIHAVLVLEVDAMPASFRVPASLDDEQLSMPSPGTAASQRAGHDSLTVRLQRCMWKVQGPVDERAALVTTVVPIHAVLVLEVDAMPASFRVPASLDDEQLSMPSPGTAASQLGASVMSTEEAMAESLRG